MSRIRFDYYNFDLRRWLRARWHWIFAAVVLLLLGAAVIADKAFGAWIG